VDEISRVETVATEDADTVILAYGSVARSAERAAKMLREEGLRVGFVRLVTLWPFADAKVRHACESAKLVVVPEMNMGKMVREVERALHGQADVHSFPKPGVDLHRPTEIAERVRGLMA